MTVTAGGITEYESSCRIASARPTRRPDAERTSVVADFECEGEGQHWSGSALFHLETVAGQKLVAVTTLSRRDPYEAPGRRINLPTTTIYTECR